MRELPVQRYSEVFGFGAEEQGFIIVVDFQVTFSFLVVKMEDCRHCFFSIELYLPRLGYSPTVAMSLFSTLCQARNQLGTPRGQRVF